LGRNIVALKPYWLRTGERGTIEIAVAVIEIDAHQLVRAGCSTLHLTDDLGEGGGAVSVLV
jgi:hypothetical protein